MTPKKNNEEKSAKIKDVYGKFNVGLSGLRQQNSIKFNPKIFDVFRKMNKKLEKLKERDEIDRLAYSDLDSSKRLPACPTLARHSENQKPIKVITKTVRTYDYKTLL